ncbi:threonylcarbamoyl-AMP synthase [Candidatus Aerophobetes bacterium]|nr:threonylcarbamoyl-AMP synthase [Candidatus Aerophobetes bacterium]
MAELLQKKFKLMIIKVDPVQVGEKIDQALKILKKGGIAAFPTDTVYGLGINAEDQRAVSKLYKIKKRPKEKPLILFLSKKEQIFPFVKIFPIQAQRLINRYWPGPLTLLFKANIPSSSPLVSKEGKIGIRIPSHPIPREIVQRSDFSLGTTSANISGKPEIINPKRLSPELIRGVNVLLDGGDALLGKVSTVVDVTSFPPQTIREGWISREEIMKVERGEGKILFVCTGNTCRSPMAEAFFKKSWPQKPKEKIKVKSAGTNAIANSKPSEFATKVMREKGIDISSHRATPLTPEIVKEYDLILTMEERHRQRVINLFPFIREKVWLLSEFISGKKEDILDPAGSYLSTYRELALRIEKEINKLMERLGGESE